ncbi:MAG: class I SAM-dependent methyltransferase [Planctomycetota bacterium]|jgi:trans-aconitate methyltransferase
MKPKPKHLGVTYASQFKEASIVDAYRYRPPYPLETFHILAELIADEPKAVLDAGCGAGNLARFLIGFADRVDAVDFSVPMIETAKRLEGGDHPNIRWICAPMEEAPLAPPYALVTAGASLHWMDWEIVIPRFRYVLAPKGTLALVNHTFGSLPWDEALREIIPRYSTNQDYQPYNLVEELEERGLFRRVGEKRTRSIPFHQSVEAYIESFHSSNGFSRERMTEEAAVAFDEEVRALVSAHVPDGAFTVLVGARVEWGMPLGRKG